MSMSIHGSVHSKLNALSHVRHANCFCSWLAIWKSKVLLTLGKSPVTISACKRIFCCVNALMFQCFNESMFFQVRILAKKNKKEKLGQIPLFLFRAYSFLHDMSVSIHGSLHNELNVLSQVEHANCFYTGLAKSLQLFSLLWNRQMASLLCVSFHDRLFIEELKHFSIHKTENPFASWYCDRASS